MVKRKLQIVSVPNERSSVPLLARLAACVAWTVDFANDPRCPHQIPWTLHRVAKQAQRIHANHEKVMRPAVLVTFDIERDIDQPFVSSFSRTAASFLEAYLAAVEASKYRTTFFVQGGMVENLESLLNLAHGPHEIGMHGYDHELWGTRNWITRPIPPPSQVRYHLLKRGINAFQRAGLDVPVSFRAPNFTADQHTYRLLRIFGFKTDSSIPTQRGFFQAPRVAGITIIPVSVAPTPWVYYNPILRIPTALHFFQFNYPNIVTSPMAEFQARVAEVFSWQSAYGRPRELVMYAHNWEFFDLTPRLPRMNGGLDELMRRLDWLADTYNARFYSMADWAQRRGTED